MTRDEAFAVVEVVLGFDFDGHPQDGPVDMLCALRERFPDQPWGELAREIDLYVDLDDPAAGAHPGRP